MLTRGKVCKRGAVKGVAAAARRCGRLCAVAARNPAAAAAAAERRGRLGVVAAREHGLQQVRAYSWRCVLHFGVKRNASAGRFSALLRHGRVSMQRRERQRLSERRSTGHCRWAAAVCTAGWDGSGRCAVARRRAPCGAQHVRVSRVSRSCEIQGSCALRRLLLLLLMLLLLLLLHGCAALWRAVLRCA